ncbi:hypothetical protein M427DRAFT_92319, partial [Gonapodya prolifera JEL478]
QQLVFYDESAYDKRLHMRYNGWAPTGHWAQVWAPFVKGQQFTIGAGLGFNGYVGYTIQAGPMDADDCVSVFEEVLLPHCNPYPGEYSVILLDNSLIHKDECIAQMCRDHRV